MTSRVVWTCDSCGNSEEFAEGNTSEIPSHWTQGILMRKNPETGKYEPEWEDLCLGCGSSR